MESRLLHLVVLATLLVFTSTKLNAQCSTCLSDQVRFSENRGLDYDPPTDAMFYNGYNNGRVVKLGDPTGNGWFMGSLGIGTASPSAKLTINQTAAADYVNAVSINSYNNNIHWPLAIRSNALNYSGFVSSSTQDMYMLLRDRDGNANVQFHSLGNSYLNGGNFGIGTTAPSQALEINGTGTELSALIWNKTTNGAKMYLTSFAGKSAIQSTGDFTIRTNNNGSSWTDKLIVTNAGNVGIGASPSASVMVDIAGAKGNPNHRNFRVTFPAGGLLLDTELSALTHLSSELGLGWTALYAKAGTSTSNYAAVFNGKSAFLNGNVGVGTSAPSSRLHVADGNGGEQLRFSRGTGIVRFAQDNNQDNLYLFNSDASKTYMVWTAAGKVGINTRTPDTELSVNGVIHTKEVRVDLTGWSDYVFEDSYHLMSLSELSKYIKANKHLPEVPSASEVLANGINIGEMNAILLKKIEELTLHLIDMKEQLDKQQKEIEQLKSK